MSAALADVADLTPAEAVEVLHMRGLWPWSPGDDAAPRWWCSPPVPRAPGDRFVDCLTCNDVGHTTAPPTLAALVAVASLGVPALRTAEELARVLVERESRIVWRVMTREALREHHERMRAAWWARLRDYGGTADPTAPQVFSAEMSLSRPPFRAESRWRRGVIGGAWPVLRDLHALGLHPVALDGDRVTLAVEST